MSYQFYKILHLVGIFLLTTGLISVLTQSWFNGGVLTKKGKAFAFATHGLGLLLLFISGFGILAKLGLFGSLPAWVYTKIGIWVLFAVLVSLLKRKGHIGWPLYFVCITLFTFAAYLGVYKP